MRRFLLNLFFVHSLSFLYKFHGLFGHGLGIQNMIHIDFLVALNKLHASHLERKQKQLFIGFVWVGKENGQNI